jgi:hypothetical protein
VTAPRDVLQHPRARNFLAATAGLFVFWAVSGFLILPRVLRPVVERKLEERLHRPATLRGLSLNPFTLSATLEGLDVKEKGGSGPFFSFESLSLNLEAASIIRGGPVIRTITLTKPAVMLVRHENGTYNVQDLLDEASTPKPGPPGKDEAPLRFSLNNIRVEGGSVDFDDRPKGTTHTVRDVRIGIPFLSNIPSKVEITTQPVFEAKVNGAPISLQGTTKPFSETRETALDLNLADVDLPFYLAYVPGDLPAKLTSARLDAKLTISFRQPLKAPPTLVISGSSALRRLALEYAGRPLLAWDRFEAVLDAVDVFGRSVRIRSLKLVAPEFWIRRETMGEHNIVTALVAPAMRQPKPAGATAPGAPEPAGPPLLVEVAEMGIEAGRVHYDNLAFHPPFHTAFSDLSLSVKGFSTATGKLASLEASAKTDAGEVFRNAGTVSMDPVAVEGTFSVEGVALKRYATFVDEFLPVEIESGLLNLKTQYRYSMGKDANTTLSGLAVDVKSPSARKKGEKEPFFRAASVSVVDTSLDLAKHELILGEVKGVAGFLAVVREKDGSADLAALVPKPPPDAPPPPPSAPWNVTLKRAALEGTTVKVEDRGWDRVARYSLTKAGVLLENLSTAPGSKGALSVRFGVDGRGAVGAKGLVGFRPMFADLRVDVKGIDLVPLEPYVLQNLKLSLAKGEVTAAARLSISEGANGRASVVVAGNAIVSNVLTVDEATKQDFLKWESFSAEGMRAGYNPMFFEAGKLAVSGVACDVTIEADGTVNLRKVVGAPAPPGENDEGDQAPAAPTTPPPPPVPAQSRTAALPVRIDALTLQGGTIRLTDRFIRPSYAATLGNLGGRVTGLSSVDGTVAELDLRGSLASRSPFQISGSLNPFAAATFADIKASFRDIDLPAFTPYSGKYAGYGIASGTLTAEVAYKLENRKLNAQNRIVADQFSFGEKVESQDATKLPVKLAVSLLKDKDGVIDLDLPIEGSIDDPKFRIGKVIWKILGNLIAKAATAPFALLGRLLGGKGEEFSSVDFADGRDVLDEAARKKLDALGKALRDRPGLKLEATGRFSGDADLEGLRRALFERKVKAQKLADLVKRGEAPGSVDDVAVTEAEWAEYLKRAYKKEKFPKPRTALGFAKDLPPPEMEKLMLANLPVTDGDLRQLALDRANAVKSYLTGPAQVEAPRVFVLEPGEKPAPPKDKARASRVDFSLK